MSNFFGPKHIYFKGGHKIIKLLQWLLKCKNRKIIFVLIFSKIWIRIPDSLSIRIGCFISHLIMCMFSNIIKKKKKPNVPSNSRTLSLKSNIIAFSSTPSIQTNKIPYSWRKSLKVLPQWWKHEAKCLKTNRCAS